MSRAAFLGHRNPHMPALREVLPCMSKGLRKGVTRAPAAAPGL